MKRAPIDIETLQGVLDMTNRFLEAHEKGDIATQLGMLQQLFEFEKAQYAKKLEALAELKKLMARVTTAKGDERVAKLVDAFEFCAKLKVLGIDDLDDRETQRTAVRHMQRIAEELDEMPPGRRGALAVLLDNNDLGVRASAGSFLWRLMPERALPVLRDVHEKTGGTSAGFTAMWARSRPIKWSRSGDNSIKCYAAPSRAGSSARERISRSGEPGRRSRGQPSRLHHTTRRPKDEAP